MSDEFNEDHNNEDEDLGFEVDPETGEPFDDDLGLVTFTELKSICEQHIKNGNDPYNEDEFGMIVEWVEETRMNETMLKMVLDGMLDVIFNPDAPNEDGEILFTLSSEAKNRLEEAQGDQPNIIKFMNLNFDEEKE